MTIASDSRFALCYEPAMAKTGSQRTAEWREELKRQGYKQKAVLFRPQALKDLAAARKRYDLRSDEEALALALRELMSRKGNK